MGCGRIRLGQNGKESVLPKRYGKNEKMSVLPKEMWSAWENVCGKKRDVVRMGKLAVRRKECSININVYVEGKGCGMGLGMYRNIGSVLECGYE